MNVKGPEGYAETAQDFLTRDSLLNFSEVHAPVLHLFPTAPSEILDVGAGSGRDAAHLAALGHQVMAVEPVDAFRAHAAATYASPRIQWVDDGLPDLAAVHALGVTFDLVLLSAVWMHLDHNERRRAMSSVAALARPRASVILSLRHGPAPPGRRMFDVTADETVALARRQDMDCLLNMQTASIQEQNRRAGVTWTRLAFRKR